MIGVSNLPEDLNPGALKGLGDLRYSNSVLLGLKNEALAAASPNFPASVSAVTLSSPDVLTLADDQTERDAILLECCDLPDKKLKLSEDDLDGIVSRFTSPVPIKLEHIDTPLDPLGAVQKIWRVGRQLMGKIAFPPDMAALVRARGCKGLSCGLERSPLAQNSYSLSELSLVLKPRLQAAVLLSEDDAAELARLRLETHAQRVELTAARVDAQILAFKRAGKIVPATEGLARILLSAPPSALITLADGKEQDVAKTFAEYLAAQMAVVTLTENALAPEGTAPEGTGPESAILFSTEEADFLRDRLGVDPANVAATIQADAVAKKREVA